jgi:hypothetical protein
MHHLVKQKITVIFLVFAFSQFETFGQTDEGEVRIQTSAHVDEMLVQKKEYNKSIEAYQGFKIQIYYGSEKKCYEVQEDFKMLFPDIATSVIFSTPQWKLQVGNFRTRLEADNTIVNIKKEYPGAIVLATAIELE